MSSERIFARLLSLLQLLRLSGCAFQFHFSKRTILSSCQFIDAMRSGVWLWASMVGTGVTLQADQTPRIMWKIGNLRGTSVIRNSTLRSIWPSPYRLFPSLLLLRYCSLLFCCCCYNIMINTTHNIIIYF